MEDLPLVFQAGSDVQTRLDRCLSRPEFPGVTAVEHCGSHRTRAEEQCGRSLGASAEAAAAVGGGGVWPWGEWEEISISVAKGRGRNFLDKHCTDN